MSKSFQNGDGKTCLDAYDSGLRYNMDPFFRAILSADGTLPRTVLVYTSDHAEVLSENGRRFPVWQTYAVPLLMVKSDRDVPEVWIH